jgi:hypothetical protein
MLVCKRTRGDFLIASPAPLFVLIWVFQVDIVLSPCIAYLIDLMHSRSAEALAANKSVNVNFIFYGNALLNIAISAFRALFISLAISGIFPMIETYGLVLTNAASALLAWLGFG